MLSATKQLAIVVNKLRPVFQAHLVFLKIKHLTVVLERASVSL